MNSDPFTLGIQTRREDVLMSSVPTTTQAEKALCRTSGGLQNTGQQVHLAPSTTPDPSTLINLLLFWTLAPLRLRSLPKTPARHLSDLRI